MRAFFLFCNCLVFFVACRDVPRSETTNAPCTTPQKITAIYKDYVYDLSGYQNSGGSTPFNLFDENNFFDPKNGISGFPETSPHPVRNADIFFPKNKGNRIVVDLRVPYKLSEIYLYDRSEAMDTVWIYTGNMADWKLKATVITKGDASAWGWRKFAIEDSSQFVQIRFNSYEANVTEAVLYGCPLQAVPPAPTYAYNGPRLPKKTLRDFLGINMYNEVPHEYIEPFKWIRMYATADLFDSDSANAYPGNKINVSRLGFRYLDTIFRHYSDDIAPLNTKMWYSIRGVPKWMNNLGLWDKDRPLTKLNMDPEDPMSYGRHAYMMWTLAAVFGKTKVDTNNLLLGDMIRVSGKGTMTEYENGNEEDAYWVGSKYGSPLEYFAQSSADFDGHMGKLGEKHGVHKADSNSNLIMSGTIGLDTNRVRILNFLCNNLRADKKFLWQGGIQYHHYSNNAKGHFLPRLLRSAGAGITPEEDSLRARLHKVREFTYRTQPGVECILGEYGFDKGQQSAQSTPIVPGYSPAQSQAIMLTRSINAVAFSGFDKLMIYWMKDQEPEQSPNIYLSSGLLYQGLDQKVLVYPSWYHIATMVHHLGNYVPDEIVSEKGNVWIYKYRHQTQKDSVALFVYAPTRTGNKYNGYEVAVSGAAKQVMEVSFVDNDKRGKTAMKNVNNGKVAVDVSEVPKLILYKE